MKKENEKEIEKLNKKIKFYQFLIKNKYRKRLIYLENITIPLMQAVINNYERGENESKIYKNIKK